MVGCCSVGCKLIVVKWCDEGSVDNVFYFLL